MKAALALSVIALVNAQSADDFESVTISVNKTGVADFYNDALQFRDLWMATTYEETNNVARALADAYKNTEAKIILNFGKTIAPVMKNIGNVFD